jgi:hypothetical protein
MMAYGRMDDYQLTLHGLLRKRGELTSVVEALRAQLGEHLAALDHIDATIRIFKPDIDLVDLPERPAPPPNAAFRGEVQRFLLHTLRTSRERLTTSQLAEAVMASRRLNTSDRVLRKLIERRTGHSLGRLRKQGFIASERYSKGAELVWFLTVRGESDEPCGGWRNASATPY